MSEIQPPPLHVALWEPEIPPNTGNIARLCAATGAALHIVGRPAFRTDDRSLRRAGLDYWDAVAVRCHGSFAEFERHLDPAAGRPRLWCLSAHAAVPYTAVAYRPGDGLVLGSESGGLPPTVLERYADSAVTIPMPTGRVRSLNLATAAGVVLYEALRQLHGW